MKRRLGEFELIARLTERLRQSRRTILGPGDDCAILTPNAASQLFTIDSIVEGVHFKLEWAAPEIWGERAMTVNLSDIAAMGGKPIACVVNLGIRDRIASSVLVRFYKGLRGAAAKANVDIVGGNVNRAKQLTATIALLGEGPAKALRRDSSRPGDGIFVTGTLGDAAAGWRILAHQLEARGEPRRFLTDRYLRPTARLAAGQRLAMLRPVAAAIDISDGLCQDLGHILERSGVGAEIDARLLPLSPAFRSVMGERRDLALGGGEDYELLFCLRPRLDARQLSRRLGLRVTRIGTITPRRGLRIFNQGRRGEPGGTKQFSGWDQVLSRG